MTTVWKLTDPDQTTFGDTLWGEGVTHTAPGGGPLCTKAWVHAYASPLLAVLMDPIHGGFGADAVLWRCDAEVGIDDSTKLGCTSLTTVERVPLPVVTTEQRVRFGILAAWEVCDDPGWRAWAGKWLDGTDRSAAEGAAAACAAWAASGAEAARPAACAAWAAAEAARRAAWAASGAEAARPAACAAWAAEDAAAWAAWAASGAEAAALDLVAIAERACGGER